MQELERLCGKMVCIGFDGPCVTADAQKLIQRGVSSVVLFRRNVESPEQVKALCASLKSVCDRPIMTCVDQEGGRVMRLRAPFTEVPSMRTLGRTGDEALAEEVGRICARELRAVNIDLNFAPVLDVDTNPQNPVIADRSLGATPELVSRMGCAVIRGLQSLGVAACGKHFPGHGDTSQDSHFSLPRLTHSLERLESIELPPFAAAVKEGVAMIMTSHVIFEPLDPKHPATMSRPTLDGILRDRMRFDGVVISDDMEMKAIAEHFSFEDSIILGTLAGVDLFAICHRADLQNQAIEILIHAVERGHIPRQRIEQAVSRIDRLMLRYSRPADRSPAGLLADVIGHGDHRRTIETILSRTAEKLESKPDPTQGWQGAE